MSGRRGPRIAAAIWTTACIVLLQARIVFAQPYPGGGQTPPDVGGRDFFPGGETPRTGWDFLLWMIVALLVILAGLALRWTSRSAKARGE